MRLGFVSCPDRGAADRLLAALAEGLLARGVAVAGLVQDPADGPVCTMTVRLLPDGARLGISQTLGAGAEGCALDTGALETALGEAAARLRPDTAVLILNKFGRIEAEGRGCRPLIATALDAGVPVILSVPPRMRADFDAFAGDLAEEIAPDLPALLNWLDQA